MAGFVAGLADPLRELREFVKDLWFRNRQESQQGELELLERRLDLAVKHGLLDSRERRLAARRLFDAAAGTPYAPHGRRQLPRGKRE